MYHSTRVTFDGSHDVTRWQTKVTRTGGFGRLVKQLMQRSIRADSEAVSLLRLYTSIPIFLFQVHGVLFSSLIQHFRVLQGCSC